MLEINAVIVGSGNEANMSSPTSGSILSKYSG
jgi:hypothetical protein